MTNVMFGATPGDSGRRPLPAKGLLLASLSVATLAWISASQAQTLSTEPELASVPMRGLDLGTNDETASVVADHDSSVVKSAQSPGGSVVPLLVPTASPPMGAASFDKSLGLRGWNIPFFSYGDTLTGDAGGWRSKLAEYGIGFLDWENLQTSFNVLNVPRKGPNGTQVYWGQQFSVLNVNNLYLTFDLGRIGITGGQFAIAGNITNSTFNAYAQTTYDIHDLAYDQRLFGNKLEINIGYHANSLLFVGTYIGGQLQNPFGASASIPVELGLSSSTSAQPTAMVKLTPFGGFYDEFAVARSITPAPGALVADHRVNPTQLDFTQPGSRALYIDEIGYRHAPAPGSPQTWFRAGAIYNTSLYKKFIDPNGETTNLGYYLLYDRQVWQVDPSSVSTAGRGLYLGFSAMYAPPSVNIFSQYYEARIYGKGLLASRPADIVVFVVNHNVLSNRYASKVDMTTAMTELSGLAGTTTVTMSYTYKIRPGLYLTGGLQYADHPSPTYYANQGHALNALFSLFVAL